MMTQYLYITDAYLKEINAKVLSVHEEGVILDQTIFYPQGGGQPSDRGYLEKDGQRFNLTGLKKDSENLYHQIEGDLSPGDEVKAVVDWDYRYKLMKHHTALHVLSAVVFRKYKAKVTGGTIYENKARLDFDLQEFNREIAQQVVDELNEELVKDHQIEIGFLRREEADKNPDLIRTKVNLLPKSISEIRTVKIGDVDFQADGGLHVKSTKEIGKVQLGKVENKGKGRKRITISVID
ncbi:MAG: alanyl-tRNA editing protein [Candidatus Heimdallarchaeota archaeon]|nr:alanyl-tRNA editing protein [Candidatus Heimdallarchaeota archaeon]